MQSATSVHYQPTDSLCTFTNAPLRQVWPGSLQTVGAHYMLMALKGEERCETKQ